MIDVASTAACLGKVDGIPGWNERRLHWTDWSGLPEYLKDPAGGSGSRSAQTIVGQSASGGGNGIKSLPWVTAALVDQGAGVYPG